MNDIKVRIVHLEPMRVASAVGVGEKPEPIAWKKILFWAAAAGLLEDPELARYFGFNNPSPSKEGEVYGYEQWMVVAPGVTADDEDAKAAGIEIKEFPGGLYAVTRCTGLANVGEAWGELGRWVQEGGYETGQHQWLEQCLVTPGSLEELEQISPAGVTLDLYFPITEPRSATQ